MSKHCTQRRNPALLIPLVMLLVGILLYSGITLYANITFPPSEMNRLLNEAPDLAEKRFALLESKECIINIFTTIFGFGSIVVLCYYIFISRHTPALSSIILGFVVAVAATFLCALILSPFDKEFSFENYLTPIWIPLIHMTLCFFVMMTISLVKGRFRK